MAAIRGSGESGDCEVRWGGCECNNEPLSMTATHCHWLPVTTRRAGGPHFHTFCSLVRTLDRVIICAEWYSATLLPPYSDLQNIFLFKNFKTKSSVWPSTPYEERERENSLLKISTVILVSTFSGHFHKEKGRCLSVFLKSLLTLRPWQSLGALMEGGDEI